ncbi:MAG: DMT family transporter [Rubrobacteraceae bacterium]
MRKPSPRVVAVFQALFVTFLWSTSWVLIKAGLEEMPALTFAGLRYALAFICLLPIVLLRSSDRAALRSLSRGDVLRLAALGLLLYSVTQGAQFVGLDLLPAVTVSLLLNFTPVVVMVLAIMFIGERPTALQLGGVILFLIGAAAYFLPTDTSTVQVLGLLVVAVGVAANAGSAVLGRFVNREARMSPLLVTVASMGVGSVALLSTGIVVEGVPSLSVSAWLIVGWLAVVNTAFAFTLWNHTLRTLPALESNFINNTMLVQIAILAWVFLGESIGVREGVGIALAALGVLIVQISGRRDDGRDRTKPR